MLRGCLRVERETRIGDFQANNLFDQRQCEINLIVVGQPTMFEQVGHKLFNDDRQPSPICVTNFVDRSEVERSPRGDPNRGRAGQGQS